MPVNFPTTTMGVRIFLVERPLSKQLLRSCRNEIQSAKLNNGQAEACSARPHNVELPVPRARQNSLLAA